MRKLQEGGWCSKGHQLTPDNIYRHNGGTTIRCRRCHLDHQSARKRRRSANRIHPLRGMHVTVYFISDDAGHIKIGCTAGNVLDRLTALQGSNATELRIEATEPGGIDREQQIHAQFSHARLRGEWFRFTPDIALHIDTLRRDVDLPANYG